MKNYIKTGFPIYIKGSRRFFKFYRLAPGFYTILYLEDKATRAAEEAIIKTITY